MKMNPYHTLSFCHHGKHAADSVKSPTKPSLRLHRRVASAMGVYVTLDSIHVIDRTQFPEIVDHDMSRFTYTTFRSKDFTNPPTYDFTSTCSIFKDTASFGSSRITEYSYDLYEW